MGRIPKAMIGVQSIGNPKSKHESIEHMEVDGTELLVTDCLRKILFAGDRVITQEFSGLVLATVVGYVGYSDNTESLIMISGNNQGDFAPKVLPQKNTINVWSKSQKSCVWVSNDHVMQHLLSKA